MRWFEASPRRAAPKGLQSSIFSHSTAIVNRYRKADFCVRGTLLSSPPITEGAFVDSELLCHSGDRARRLDHHLHGFIPEFRREALLRPGQNTSPFQTPILMDGLSGKFGAPHRSASLGSATSGSLLKFCGSGRGGTGRVSAYAASVVVTVRVWSPKLATKSSLPPSAWT